MNFTRFSAIIFILFVSLFSISCSGTSEVTTGEKSDEKSSLYPGWYRPDASFVPDSAHYRGYATVLAGDSAAAVRKAGDHAAELLQTGISRKLEDLRKKAVDELGKSSGLDTPGFIVTLRRAETQISRAAGRVNIHVDPNEPFSGYRGFAETAADKKSVIRELDEAMARYKTAWNAMKTSQAFSKF